MGLSLISHSYLSSTESTCFFPRMAKLTGAVALPRPGGKPAGHAGNACAAPVADDVLLTDDAARHAGHGRHTPTPPRRTHAGGAPPRPSDAPDHATPDRRKHPCRHGHDAQDNGLAVRVTARISS